MGSTVHHGPRQCRQACPLPPMICARRPRVPLSLKLTDTWAVAPFGLSRAKLMWTGVSESPPGLLLPSLGQASS